LQVRGRRGTLSRLSEEPDLTWDERSALILALMRIEAKLDELLRLWEDDDGEEEDADS
jgi:hypothetical protein